MEREELVRALVRYAAAGNLEPRQVLPALRQLTEGAGPDPDPAQVVEALRLLEEPALRELAAQIASSLRKEALRFHNIRAAGGKVPEDLRKRLGDLPAGTALGWTTAENAVGPIQLALSTLREWFFVMDRRDAVPETCQKVERKLRVTSEAALGCAGVWNTSTLLAMVRAALESRPELADTLAGVRSAVEGKLQADRQAAHAAVERGAEMPDGVDENVALQQVREGISRVDSPEAKRRLIDLLCRWRTDAAGPVLAEAVREPRAEDRASLLLTIRFGEAGNASWEDWKRWLAHQGALRDRLRERLMDVLRSNALLGLHLWYSGRKDADASLRASLEEAAIKSLAPVRPESFVEQWAWAIPASEWEAVAGKRRPAAPPAPALVRPPVPAFRSETPPPAPEPAPPVPHRPPLWEAHLKPFFLDNWYLVAGVLMFLVGSSVVAYYTWDKHWLVRYTLMPSFLGLFTATLAWVGAWIERRDVEHRGTAAVLRGAAVALLPVNFMAVALLANDPQVSHKTLAVPLLGALYLGVFGWGLNRWCRAVHPSLGLLLGVALLFLNGLTLLGSLERVAAGATLHHVVGGGFYAGFAALAAAVVLFTRRVLTPDLALEKRVPWFFGATLAATFLQVFAWVHGYLRYLPPAATYAPMMILSGWLVLYVERKSLPLESEGGRHGAESFLGFALILLGLLMGASEEKVRILSFLLAGGVWLYSCRFRKEPLHAWIGLSLLSLGGASVALLDVFPKPWIPAVGVGAALAMGLLSALTREELSRAARGMQGALLAITTLVAPLAQWHTRSAPWATGACLILVAALFGFRAWRDQRARWLQSGMVVLALALPYLGCVDLEVRTLRGNTLVFGLAALSLGWIALTARAKSRVLLDSRSTVLWGYGALAVAGMILRVFLERAPDPDWYRAWTDYAGPILMTGALLFATYFSRSLVPAVMAIIISAVLFPEMKGHIRATFPTLGWGSGLGTASAALLLTLLAFRLRVARFLQDLKGGDLFLGRDPFPLRREDHTLFTWPALAAALFFTLKVETWNFVRNLPGVSLKAAIALALTGVVWTLVAIYHRRRPGSAGCTWAGLFWLVLGVLFAHGRLAPDAAGSSYALAGGLTVQAAFFLYRFGLERAFPWAATLLTAPARQALRYGSLVLSLGTLVDLLFGQTRPDALAAFVAAQLVWHALGGRRRVHAIHLFVLLLVCLLAWTAPGTGMLLDRLSFAKSLAPTLYLLLGIQVLHLAFEGGKGVRTKVEPLAQPFLVLGSWLGIILGFAGLVDGVARIGLTPLHHALMLAVLAFTARSLASAPVALLAAALGYMAVQLPALHAAGSESARVLLLTSPWRLALFSLALAVLAYAGRELHRRRPALLRGAFAPRPPAALSGILWFWVPAGILAWGASLLHTFNPSLREQAVQIWAPYLASAAFAVLAAASGRVGLHAGTAALLSLGNIHAVRVALGPALLARGLSEIHLLCLGLAASLLEATLLRRVLRGEALVRFANQASLAAAGLVLGLLSAHYVAHPDLGGVTWARFAISGAMALLAGLYFRRGARRPMSGEERFAGLCEGFYHYGVTLAFWCGALMIPALRTPLLALVALGVPLLYFYARAESGGGAAARYRTSAATLGFVLLGFYAFRGIFQIIIFPDTPFQWDYYHKNSPVVFVIGLVLLRLHGLAGSPGTGPGWLAFYGGLAVMTSSYFAVTALPGLSPFRHPIPAAWVSLAMAHFWTIASTRSSPLRTAVERLANLDGPSWYALRRPWGLCLLLASQGAVLWGLLNYEDAPLHAAPLLFGAASVLIHHGILRGSAAYHWIARVQIFLALHAGFLIASLLPGEHVVWAVLGLWAGLVVTEAVLRGRFEIREMGLYAALLGALTAAHVVYHGPASAVGLGAVALGATLGALTPRPFRSAASRVETVSSAALLFVPAWLVYFSQAPFEGDAWTILATAGTLLLTGCFAGLHSSHLARAYAALARPRPRLFDQTISWMTASGATIRTALLWTTFLVTGGVQLLHALRPFPEHELFLLGGLHAAFIAAWLWEGSARRNMAPYVLVQFAVLGLFLVVRQQLVLTTSLWKPEYDVAAALGVSVVLSGVRPFLDKLRREVRAPLVATLLILPALALAGVLGMGLGSTWVLIVVGIHSFLFAYMGKDERESPYHVVAVAGFVTFVLVLFWAKLGLREAYAYAIPVGSGVLVLLQLLRQRVEAATRNGIRVVALLAMLGSTAFYAIFRSEHALAYNLTLVVASLAAMALGGVVRVRLYLVLGFAALVLDLLTLLGKAVAGMERSARMISVGSVVVVVGVGLVFGAVFYKINRKDVDAWLERFRLRFAGWE